MFVVLFDADIKNIIQLIKNTGETVRHKINHIQNVLNTQYGLLNHTQVFKEQRLNQLMTSHTFLLLNNMCASDIVAADKYRHYCKLCGKVWFKYYLAPQNFRDKKSVNHKPYIGRVFCGEKFLIFHLNRTRHFNRLSLQVNEPNTHVIYFNLCDNAIYIVCKENPELSSNMLLLKNSGFSCWTLLCESNQSFTFPLLVHKKRTMLQHWLWQYL